MEWEGMAVEQGEFSGTGAGIETREEDNQVAGVEAGSLDRGVDLVQRLRGR